MRLLASIAQKLDGDMPSASLRVADIVEGVCAHGTFYRYFTDMSAALESLLSSFVEHLTNGMSEARSGEAASPERVHAATLAYVRLFRSNTGLMRCLMALAPGESSAKMRYHALNKEWNGRVARALAAKHLRSGKKPSVPASAFLITAYALGGMVDEFLANLYLRGDPVLQDLAESEEVVADLLTAIWLRGADANPTPRGQAKSTTRTNVADKPGRLRATAQPSAR